MRAKFGVLFVFSLTISVVTNAEEASCEGKWKFPSWKKGTIEKTLMENVAHEFHNDFVDLVTFLELSSPSTTLNEIQQSIASVPHPVTAKPPTMNSHRWYFSSDEADLFLTAQFWGKCLVKVQLTEHLKPYEKNESRVYSRYAKSQ